MLMMMIGIAGAYLLALIARGLKCEARVELSARLYLGLRPLSCPPGSFLFPFAPPPPLAARFSFVIESELAVGRQDSRRAYSRMIAYEGEQEQLRQQTEGLIVELNHERITHHDQAKWHTIHEWRRGGISLRAAPLLLALIFVVISPSLAAS